jgi:hypothetical protein
MIMQANKKLYITDSNEGTDGQKCLNKCLYFNIKKEMSTSVCSFASQISDKVN